jgi:hypothetical protein
MQTHDRLGRRRLILEEVDDLLDERRGDLLQLEERVESLELLPAELALAVDRLRRAT